MNTITVKIPEDLEVRLAAEAESRHTTKSEVVRAALRRSSGKGKRSAYAAMKGGCGLVKEGPPDLSTNKKHLREYGK